MHRRLFRLPISLLLPRVVVAKTIGEHRKVMVTEEIILEEECPLCTHQDTCLVLATRIAHYPHLTVPAWEYPENPDIWVLQSQIHEAHCCEFVPDEERIQNYRKPVCPPEEEEEE